ncbi:MAG: cell wall-binding protein [Myxococcales bacterium]|nr:cell wall-binding protein [Myxococcales bacterium]
MRTRYLVMVLLSSALASCGLDVGADDEDSVEQDVLGPPTGVTASATAPDRITVSWNAVAGAVKYYVYQSASSAGPFTFVNTERAPGTSLEVAHLSGNTQYCFAVRTDDLTGPGGLSTAVCTTTPTTPPAPNSVVVNQLTPTSVKVEWTAVTGASKYYVYQSSAVNGTYSYVATALSPNTSLNRTGLQAMTTYCYKVITQSSNGASPFSVSGCNNSLHPPSAVTATRTSSSRIRVDWTKATGAVKYYIFESRAGGALIFRSTVLNTATPTYSAASLTTGVQYCYQLKTQGTPTTNISNYSLPPACATP